MGWPWLRRRCPLGWVTSAGRGRRMEEGGRPWLIGKGDSLVLSLGVGWRRVSLLRPTQTYSDILRHT